MSRAPFLSADPLRLLPFSEAHLTEAYVGWLNDPAVVRFSEQRHRRHDMRSCADYVAGFASGPGLLWAVERSDGVHLGNLSATIDANNGLADIGILLGHSEARGRGYGRIAWGKVLGHLCERPDLRKITGGCLATNVAMLNIMNGWGMAPDGRRPAHYLWEGGEVDIVYCAIRPNRTP